MHRTGPGAIRVGLALLVAATAARAQSQELHFQGKLTNPTTGQPIAGLVTVEFRLYDVPAGGTPLGSPPWTETHSTNADSNGVFSILLGSATPFPGDLTWAIPYYLEIKVGAEVLSPRFRLASTPYAQRAVRANEATTLSSLVTPITALNQLNTIDSTVSGANLNTVTGGGNADPLHSHSLTSSSITGILPPAKGGLGIGTSAVTKGSLLYTSATGEWTTLAPGSDGKVLALNGGVPVWSNVSGGPLPGIVGPASGGTGVDSSGASGLAQVTAGAWSFLAPTSAGYLRSDGTTWQASSILAGDLPSGSAFYIQNQADAMQIAQFRVGKALPYSTSEGYVAQIGSAFTGNAVGNQPCYTVRIAESMRAYGQVGAAIRHTGGIANGGNDYSYVVDHGFAAPWSSAGWFLGSEATVTVNGTGTNEDHVFGMLSHITTSGTAAMNLSGNDEIKAARASVSGSFDGAGMNTIALYAANTASGTATHWAGWFQGNVNVAGSLSKGAGSFLIDHPEDPLNKTLRHNFVESPENLCLYRGTVMIGSSGFEDVAMPSYFPRLTDAGAATATLTPVGAPFAAGYEWVGGKLRVHGTPNRTVSYLVMADRNDPVMRMLRRPVEQAKGEGNVCSPGKLLYPTAYGFDASRSAESAEPVMNRMQKTADPERP